MCWVCVYLETSCTLILLSDWGRSCKIVVFLTYGCACVMKHAIGKGHAAMLDDMQLDYLYLYDDAAETAACSSTAQ